MNDEFSQASTLQLVLTNDRCQTSDIGCAMVGVSMFDGRLSLVSRLKISLYLNIQMITHSKIRYKQVYLRK
jgi:hypothetical protein